MSCLALFAALPCGMAGDESPSPLLRGVWIKVGEEGEPVVSLRFDGRWMVISYDGEEKVRGLFRIAGLREDGGLKILVAGQKWKEPLPSDEEDPFAAADAEKGISRFVIKSLGDDRCSVTLSNGLDWSPMAKIPDIIYRRPKSDP